MRHSSTISVFDLGNARLMATSSRSIKGTKLLVGMFIILGLRSSALAQDGFCCDPTSTNYDPPNCIGSGDFFGDPDCIPIDGGLSLLALAGGGLAVASLRKRREEEEGDLNA